MKYLQSCAVVYTTFCIYFIVSVKAKANDSTDSVISKNNPNEKYKNHNMDGWTPIKPTLDYLKLNQRKNCVSIGFYNVDCNKVTGKPKKSTKYKSIVDLFQRDYHSPYGNYVAEIVPKLPNHYKNPLPRHRQTNRREFRRFSSNIQRNIELPRFIDDEYPISRIRSRSFHDSALKYRKWHQYPMFEPIPGQILYPPSVPQFKSNPLHDILHLNSRIDDDFAYRRHNMNIKTFQSTIFPFFEHESVTKRSSTIKENVRSKSKLNTTPPVFSMVIEPTTIKVSSTTSGIKPTTIDEHPIQYVYSVAANHSNRNNNILNDFEKELPRNVVIAPPKKSTENDRMNITGNGIISTKLSNRRLEYTTSGYSIYVTIRPERRDSESSDEHTNELPKTKNRINVIPLLHSEERNFDSNEVLTSFPSSSSAFNSGNGNRTYIANNAGFMITAPKRTKKTTLKPQIYTLSSLLMDTDDQSASHQLSKPGQYVDHLSSTIINDYVGKTQRTERPAEAVPPSSITMKHQPPPLPNKSNNQNTTNSRWTTQPHALYTINNNDGINDRDQKIKDINLDVVITTDGPTATTTNRNQIYENRNYSGINDGDEWNDGNVDGNSRAFNGYGRVNVEPNVDWIMVAKSSVEDPNSKFSNRHISSRSERLLSSSYKDHIIPMSMKRMPKVNNSNMVLDTFGVYIVDRVKSKVENTLPITVK